MLSDYQRKRGILHIKELQTHKLKYYTAFRLPCGSILCLLSTEDGPIKIKQEKGKDVYIDNQLLTDSKVDEILAHDMSVTSVCKSRKKSPQKWGGYVDFYVKSKSSK